MAEETAGKSGKIKRGSLRRSLKIVADANCGICCGSGLKLSKTYSDACNEVRLVIAVCRCVHVEVR